MFEFLIALTLALGLLPLTLGVYRTIRWLLRLLIMPALLLALVPGAAADN